MIDPQYLKQIPFFSGLSDSELAALGEVAGVLDVKAGEPLFRPGEPRGTFLLVLSGQVHIYGVLGDEVQTLALLDQNEFAVESALVNPDLKHSHSGDMVSDGQLLIINGSDFAKLRNSNPGVALGLYERIIANLSERLHHANNKIGAIFTTGRIAATYANLDHVAELLLETVMQITRAKHALFALFRPLEDRAIIRTAKGYENDQVVQNLDVRLGNDVILGAIYATGSDVSFVEEDYKQHKELHTDYASRTMLGTPLILQNTVIGAILLGEKDGKQEFSHNNRILLNIIARQIVPLVVSAEQGERRQ